MTKKPKITFLDSATIDPGDLDLNALNEFGDCTFHQTTNEEETLANMKNAEIVITNKVNINSSIIGQSASLKLIVVCATGVNNIDLNAAKDSEIIVSNVANYSTPIVAQHTLALLLNLCGNTYKYLGEKDLWPESQIFTRLAHPVTELNGKIMGIAGAGNIGSLVGEISEQMGMRIHILSRGQSSASNHPEWPRINKEDFFSKSDVISLHCPLTKENEHMINSYTLEQMKPTSFFINTSRGGLVNENDLADALRSSTIAGAALDVLSTEPPGKDHPLMSDHIPNLLITPHIAWISLEARKRLLEGVIGNIQSFLSGSPSNRVA
ncbi:MAG: D-2-hydroxyacid dehydrogenase [Verrucomicrobiales bacterium]|nr:D-2-hydroxyacid dehydrogenase [Verrucomicrobiales bacterium]